MKHLRQTVLFILLGFLLTACHHTADRLLSIEQLIKLKPDSALLYFAKFSIRRSCRIQIGLCMHC